jgi:hypothetical protein
MVEVVVVAGLVGEALLSSSRTPTLRPIVLIRATTATVVVLLVVVVVVLLLQPMVWMAHTCARGN